MGPRYLLDTNICIYIVKHRPAEVHRRFEACSPGDLAMIAAHALAAGLTLISNNQREFARIEALSVENWAA